MISFLPAAAQPAARELLMTPARRLILLVGVPLSVTLLAWTCYGIISKASQGSYTVSYSPVRVSGGLAMNVYGGDVTLQGGVAPSAAQFTGAGTVWYGLTYSGQRPTLATAQTAAGTRINFACPDYNCALSSSVDVPPQVPVTVTSNGGNVTAIGISDATLQTAGGNLTVDGLTGDVSLNTDGQWSFRRRQRHRHAGGAERHRGQRRRQRRPPAHHGAVEPERHHRGRQRDAAVARRLQLPRRQHP